jgi:hypothetical protein
VNDKREKNLPPPKPEAQVRKRDRKAEVRQVKVKHVEDLKREKARPQQEVPQAEPGWTKHE